MSSDRKPLSDGGQVVPINGLAKVSGTSANGHTNGHSNGSANGHPNGHVAIETNGHASNGLLNGHNGSRITMNAESVLGDRLPPYNIEAEEGSLGSMLRDNEMIPGVLAAVDPDDYYRDIHQIVFRAIEKLHKAGKPADVITLQEELMASGKLDYVGGLDFILHLIDSVPHAVNAIYYAQIVKQKALAREMIDAAHDLLKDGYSNQYIAEELLERFKEAIAKVEEKARRSGTTGTDEVISLDQIVPEAVEWLWEGRIPLGFISLFAGQPGLGKSLTSIDIAARVSVGGEIPDRPGEHFEVGSVLVISSEDTLKQVIVPRLIAAGADRSRIQSLHPNATRSFSLNDLPFLERRMNETPDLRLIIIDPPTAYVGKANDHKNAELRGLLDPLASFAERHRVAILFLTHVSKSDSKKAGHLVIGGIGWNAAPRATWLFKKDDQDKRRTMMLSIKTNLGAAAPGVAYQIDKVTLDGFVDKDGKPLEVGRVIWDPTPIDLDADESVAAESERKPKGKAPVKREAAMDWLSNLLEEYAYPSTEIFDLGKAAGISKDTLYDAKGALGINASKRGFTGGWHWGFGESETWRLRPQNPNSTNDTEGS